MKRNVGIALVLAGVLAFGAWQMWPSATEQAPPSQPSEVSKPVPTQVPPSPPSGEASLPEPPQLEAVDPPAPPQPEIAPPQEVAKDDPFGGKPITVETLTGCKEVQQLNGTPLVIEYARNGEWKVNGNSRAKWTIENNRVKIYKDGTDEVHYVEIVGNKLVYNGKEIAMTR